MKTQEDMARITLEHTRQLPTLEQKIEALEKRTDANEKILKGIHKIAANQKSLTCEVKRIGKNQSKSNKKIETSRREQGKRIGELESAFIRLSNIEAMTLDNDKRLKHIENEPGQKWQNMTAQVVSLIVAAIVAGIVAMVTMN